MYRKLELQDFEGFLGNQEVRLAQLTLIMGPNSSGKSSIYRALNRDFARDIIRESTSLENLPDAIAQSINLTFDYQALGYGSDFEILAKYSSHGEPSFSLLQRGEILLSLDVADSYSSKQGNLSCDFENLGFMHLLNNFFMASDRGGFGKAQPDKKAWHKLFSNLSFSHEDALKSSGLFEPASSIEETMRQGFVRMVGDLLFSMDDTIYETRYVAALRARFNEMSAEMRHQPYMAEMFGVQIPRALTWLDEQSEKDLEELDLELINNQLLGLTHQRYEVRVYSEKDDDEYGDWGRRSSVEFIDRYTNATLGATQVGTGLSQVWPILFELAHSDSNPLYIEQPELHLHARMQADLGHVIVESLGRDGGPSQVILETHSESILLSVQKSIRAGKICPNDVTVIYCEPSPQIEGEAGALRFNLMSNIEFEKNGELQNDLPISFGGIRLNELFE